MLSNLFLLYCDFFHEEQPHVKEEEKKPHEEKPHPNDE